MKIGIVQNKPGLDKKKNLKDILELIPKNDFDILVLPECFNSPYGIEFIKHYAENLEEEGETLIFLNKLSLKYNKSYIIAGSIPEYKNYKYYNTCTVWFNGNIIAIYRKIYLFDFVNNEKSKVFKESVILSSGNKPVFFKTPWGNIGLGICFDLRFNELSNFYKKNDCNILIYPGNFTKWTGDLHWKLLLRARAIDNQCFVVGCATAENIQMKYKSYGHSIIVNPLGEINLEFDSNKASEIFDINLDQIQFIKKCIPLNNIITL